MSFCGHEIHVGVDCFSVEPLGLRPRGSLFLPPCELVNQNPQQGFRCSLGDNRGLDASPYYVRPPHHKKA